MSVSNSLPLSDAFEAYERVAFEFMPIALYCDGHKIIKSFGNVKRLFGAESFDFIEDLPHAELKSLLSQAVSDSESDEPLTFSTSDKISFQRTRVTGVAGSSLTLFVFDVPDPETGDQSKATNTPTPQDIGEGGDQQLLHTILDHSPFLTAFIDRDLRYQYVNQRYADFANRSRESILGTKLPDLAEGYFDLLRPHLEQALSGETVNYQITIPGDDQKPVWLEITHVPEFDLQGEVNGFYCFSNDITELREQERLMNLVFTHVPALIALFDKEMRFRFANHALLKTMGFSLDNVIGKPLVEIIGAKSFAVAQPNFRRALQGEKRIYENQVTRGNGEVLDVLVHLVPDTDSLGETTGICALLVDISDLKKAHEELQNNEFRFQSAVAGSSLGIVEFDCDKLDWVFSKHVESLLGFEEGAFNNSRQKIRARIHPEDLERNDQARVREENGENTHIELRLKNKSGTYRWFSINSRIQKDDSGRPKKVIGTISDVDELKQAQLKAADDLRRRDEFLAMLSHELRNPMAAITFSLDGLHEHHNLPPDSAQLIEIISRQTTQMSKLLQDLLDVSRLTQNRIDFSFVTHDLNESVPDVVNSIRPAITTKRQNLHLQLSEEPLMIRADIARLNQAMVNVLDNASKYTPEDGEIWLATRRQGDQAIVSVMDSGFGIEDSTRDNIFDLFFQANQPLHRKPGGIGVGLYLVNQIVGAHSGSVVAASDGAGRGSQFTISIPLTTDTLNHPQLPVPPLFHGRHVIVVEDNADSRNSLTRLLKQRGFCVTEFVDGESVTAMFDSLQFDVAIIDIGLPGKNGLELAREIRQLDHLKEKLLIAMTGYSQTSDRQSAISAGFDLHVVKPTNVDQLCAAIAASLRKNSAGGG